MSKEKITTNSYQISSSNSFCCSLCKYTAKGEKGIKLHLKYTHNIKPSKAKNIITECGICGKILKNDIDIRKHTRKGHQVLL